jgi:predicted nucleic acid-binding protein
MKTVVIDTSIAIKWVLFEPDSPKAQALLFDWTGNGVEILAPHLLAYEAANSLYQKARKGEITLDRARQALKRLLNTDIEFEVFFDQSLSLRALDLANHHNLPATYDAHFLALAEKKGCELWTADTRLWNTIRGKLAWVRWLDDYIS